MANLQEPYGGRLESLLYDKASENLLKIQSPQPYHCFLQSTSKHAGGFVTGAVRSTGFFRSSGKLPNRMAFLEVQLHTTTM